ncbi:MAG: hypothetical protein OHK0039_00160 [Bacteroidia bacterium]
MICIHLRHTLSLALLSLLLTAAACQPAANQPPTSTRQVVAADERYTLPYSLKNPQARYTLPDALREVSGLGYLAPGRLAMVQDEKGRIYTFDLAADSVTGYVKFAGKGDYEGVECVGDTVYALQSEGVLSAVAIAEGDSPVVRRYATGLGVGCDAEGLAYDAATHSLLIACKAAPYQGLTPVPHLRVVYAFDLRRGQMAAEPAFTIDLHELAAFLRASARSDKEKARAAAFDPLEDGVFQPSALARHPLDGHLYVLASSGQLLVVLDDRHRIVAAHRLPRDPFVQPEGIAFDPEGRLFIANEGRDGAGTLLRFDPGAGTSDD